MKSMLKTLAIPMLLSLSPELHADDGLPTDEYGFVEAVPGLSKAKIAELLGDPSESIVVTDPRSGKVVGQIWRYEYLNTNLDGDYYKSTELDIVGDKVVNIIFSNTGVNRTNSVAASATECIPSC